MPQKADVKQETEEEKCHFMLQKADVKQFIEKKKCNEAPMAAAVCHPEERVKSGSSDSSAQRATNLVNQDITFHH